MGSKNCLAGMTGKLKKFPWGISNPVLTKPFISLCVFFEVEHKGEDWESLEKVRLPLCLNLSQCKLELGEYQEVVDLNSILLKKHKGELILIYCRNRH